MPRHTEDQDETGARDNLSERELKKQLKQMKKDLKSLQKRATKAEEGRANAEKEKEALQLQIDEGNGPNPPNNRNATAGAVNRPQLSQTQLKNWFSKAKVAGARAAALYGPFLDIEPLAGHQVQNKIDTIIDEVKRAQEGDEELEDESNPAIYWKTNRFSCPAPVDMSREIIFNLPKSPGNMWLEDWFQNAVGLGVRKLRSSIVHDVALFYEKIFGITNPEFKTRSNRPDLPEVQALQGFLHINEKDDEGNTILEVFFRDRIIVWVLRLLLLGPSAIETGNRSAKACKCHSQLWHVKQITPSLLAFAATVIHFVLSGDLQFEPGSGSIDYSAWYQGRLRLLKGVHDRHPDIYDDLMAYYNREVFGTDPHNVPADQGDQDTEDEMFGMDEGDLAFLEVIGA